jgi:activator of 2-hydroxyglutaryl-CoA dehydratase
LRALQVISSQTRIVCDDQGELAGARGAALLALDALFSREPQLLESLLRG